MYKVDNVLSQLVTMDKYGSQIVAGSSGLFTKTGIYIYLRRMSDNGLIRRLRKERAPKGCTGPQRVIYTITELGRQYLHEHERVALLPMEKQVRPDSKVSTI